MRKKDSFNSHSPIVGNNSFNVFSDSLVKQAEAISAEKKLLGFAGGNRCSVEGCGAYVDDGICEHHHVQILPTRK